MFSKYMALEYCVRLLAGTFFLLSVTSGYFVSPYWFLMTIFVGINLVQSSFSGFCPAEKIISRLFFKKSSAS